MDDIKTYDELKQFLVEQLTAGKAVRMIQEEIIIGGREASGQKGTVFNLFLHGDGIGFSTEGAAYIVTLRGPDISFSNLKGGRFVFVNKYPRFNVKQGTVLAICGCEHRHVFKIEIDDPAES